MTTQDDTHSKLFTASIHRWKRGLSAGTGIFSCALRMKTLLRDQDDRSLLLIPGIAFNRRKISGTDGPDPKTGYLVNIKLEGAHTAWGASARFTKVWGRTKGVVTLADRHRFIGRMEQGSIWVDDITCCPLPCAFLPVVTSL